jgi:hypothetical protein
MYNEWFDKCPECGHRDESRGPKYKIPVKVKSRDLKKGDEIQRRQGEYDGGMIAGDVVVSPKGKILVYEYDYSGFGTNRLLFGYGLDPDKNITILVKGQPDPNNGFYEI